MGQYTLKDYFDQHPSVIAVARDCNETPVAMTGDEPGMIRPALRCCGQKGWSWVGYASSYPIPAAALPTDFPPIGDPIRSLVLRPSDD